MKLPPLLIGVLALLAGWLLLAAGVYLLAGRGWALVSASVPFIAFAVIIFRGIASGE